MKRYSLSTVSEATGYGRKALSLYAAERGWNKVRGFDLLQIVDFMKAMKNEVGRSDEAEVEELRSVLRSSGLIG